MNIAFVSLMRAIPWGGSEDLWYKAAKLAVARGHTVYSITQRWDKTPERIIELSKIGVKTNFYFSYPASLKNRILNKIKFFNKKFDYIPQINADVYVISNGSTWDFIYFKSIIDAYTSVGKKYILISQHNFESGNIVAPDNRAFALDIISRSAKYYFVAQRNLAAAERQLAYRIPSAHIISNPLNTHGRSIKPYPESATLLLACVARLECEFKGQDILLQALSTEPWSSRDYLLKLYGTGKDLAHIQNLISLYSLQGKVILAGQVNDVDHIWETNQIMILPSLSEGTPLALMEAMMAGRPALATNVGDSGRYVITGKTGFLAATASVECLRDGLEYLWNNRHQLKSFGEAAFHHAFSITNLSPEKTLVEAIEAVGAQ